MKQLPTLRWLGIIFVVLLLAAFAACSGEDAVTLAPAASAPAPIAPEVTLLAPTATATPVPTAIPTPTPAAHATPHPDRVPPVESDSVPSIDAFTARVLVELLPDHVIACLSGVLGAETYTEALDTPLLDSAITDSILRDCFSSEDELLAWVLALGLSSLLEEDGRLSSESIQCLIPVATSSSYVYGIFAGVHVASPTPEEYISGNIGVLLCFTDEEAAVLSADPNGSGGLPTPSELRCMDGELESLEPLELLYIWREPDVEATRAVAAAAQQCGVEHGPWNLGAATRMCVRPIWDATNGLSVSELPPSSEEIVLGALESLLCHTDEEAEDVILSSSIEGGATLLPSELRCMKDRLGGLDALVMLMLGQEIDPETNEHLSEAAEACGADLESFRPTGSVFP